MKNYPAVNNRCAINFGSLELGLSEDESLQILQDLGFEIINVDIVETARALVSKVNFALHCMYAEAPQKMNCAGFVKWVYGQAGINLPRRAIQQYLIGAPVEQADIHPGDLFFTDGSIFSFECNSNDKKISIGHVSIVGEGGNLIYASHRFNGVVEKSQEELLSRREFKGACRIIPTDENIMTLNCPPKYEIESSDDIRWIIQAKIK